MPHTLVIADDVTGANDIGIMYAKTGQTVLVYSADEKPKSSYEDCEVLIIDTDSRFDRPERAYQKVYKLAVQLRDSGVRQFVNKQCSVFRGNIGAEFDAMLDALEEEFAVVVLGFPKNGRTTLNSIHYVHGELLENSQFRSDPVHPMQLSDLREILKKQTKRRVGAIHWQVYEQGQAAVRQVLEQERRQGGYCIMDVRDNEDLKFLAELLSSEKIICGSSALAEYLADNSGIYQSAYFFPPDKEAKVFCVCGSLTPQTAEQIEAVRAKGCPVYEMDSLSLLEAASLQEEKKRLMGALKKAMTDGSFALLHSSNQAEKVAATKRLAQSKGMDNTQISSVISQTLAELTAELVAACGLKNLIICGGDTSAAVCRSLEIQGMKILNEIEVGLPCCQSVTPPYYRLVLKSGSFGSQGFIEKAIAALRGEMV